MRKFDEVSAFFLMVLKIVSGRVANRMRSLVEPKWLSPKSSSK